jgi:hypothetical protein
MEPLPNNAVKIMSTYIILGNSVMNFFKKKQLVNMSIILDYKHGSIILWGDKKEEIANASNSGYVIYYPDMSFKSRPVTYVGYSGVNKLTIIYMDISKYIDVSVRYYIAKPLNDCAVILENVLLTGPGKVTGRGFFNINEQFFLLGDTTMGRDLKPEDLIRKERKLQAKQVMQTTQTLKMPVSIKAHTQSTAQTQSPQSQSQLLSMNSQNIHKQPMLSSKMQEKQAENMLDDMPTSEEIARAENEYKKMILGE